jgi:sterol desaturase/sphingolipid hydroxylase (fatty acid hydroxylase superfamily)
MSIMIIVTLVLASSGLCMGGTMLAYAKMPERRLYKGTMRLLGGPAVNARRVLNMIFSLALVYAATFLLQGRLFHERPEPWWRSVLQGVAILAVYDLLYYLTHRFLFHGTSYLTRVHAVHHKAKHPTAIDSLFLHPVENFLGLALLFFVTWLVGPISVYTFGGCFFLYSWFNIIVHAGVDLPVPYAGFMARKHGVHHEAMRNGNFASLSPLPDRIFGTAE